MSKVAASKEGVKYILVLYLSLLFSADFVFQQSYKNRYNQIVKQFGSRSELLFRQAQSGSLIFAKFYKIQNSACNKKACKISQHEKGAFCALYGNPIIHLYILGFQYLKNVHISVILLLHKLILHISQLAKD